MVALNRRDVRNIGQYEAHKNSFLQLALEADTGECGITCALSCPWGTRVEFGFGDGLTPSEPRMRGG